MESENGRITNVIENHLRSGNRKRERKKECRQVRNKANKRQTDKQTESGQAKTINLLSAAVVLTLYSLQTLLSTNQKKCKKPKSK